MTKVAPGVKLYHYGFRNLSHKCKLRSYQAAVLIITFFTYTSYHLAKKSFSTVKGELAPKCNVTTVNNTCFPWSPFTYHNSKELFGLVDCAFLLSYALAMFVSGYIAEHTNLRLYLASGMVLTGIFTAFSGVAYFFKIHSLSFFFLVQIVTGVTQSTGWPCVVESVGMWFPAGRRGLIMGIWNTHTSIGNILGSAIAGAFVDTNWGLSFVVPGAIILFFGIIVYLFLIPDPSLVEIDFNRDQYLPGQQVDRIVVSPDPIRSPNDTEDGEEPAAIGIWGALKIPGVIEYSLCLFFAKLVSYTFLFWLPFYIEDIKIAGKQYDAGQASDWAILFDVGGAFGGIVAGIVTDVTHCPAIVNVVMLLLAGPSLILFYFHGTAKVSLFIAYMMISGFFVNGPYALITTAVSASLGTHECLQGNTKAMAVVTSIIDGTGSLGAAVGPLLAGIISSKGSWGDVFYMLICCDVLAAILLLRQLIAECRSVFRSCRRHMTSASRNSDQGSMISAENEPLMSSVNT